MAAIFVIGMGLATASNDEIVPPFFAIHPLWHIVGALGFMFFWAFKHVACEARDAQRATPV